MWVRESLMGHMNTQGSCLIAMASQISSHELAAFMSGKRLSVLMYPKLSFSTTLELVALKAVSQAALDLSIYNSSDTQSCKFFRVLFWIQVLNCCSCPADIAQNLPKAFFCR